jgi:hypothetical protein
LLGKGSVDTLSTANSELAIREEVLSLRSVQRLYNEDHLTLGDGPETAVKRIACEDLSLEAEESPLLEADTG